MRRLSEPPVRAAISGAGPAASLGAARLATHMTRGFGTIYDVASSGVRRAAPRAACRWEAPLKERVAREKRMKRQNAQGEVACRPHSKTPSALHEVLRGGRNG